MNGTTDIQNITWGNSYECDLDRSYNLTSVEDGEAVVIFPYIRVQVFNFSEPGNFSEGMCATKICKLKVCVKWHFM